MKLGVVIFPLLLCLLGIKNTQASNYGSSGSHRYTGNFGEGVDHKAYSPYSGYGKGHGYSGYGKHGGDVVEEETYIMQTPRVGAIPFAGTIGASGNLADGDTDYDSFGPILFITLVFFLLRVRNGSSLI